MASLLHCLFRHCFEHQERGVRRRNVDDDGEILSEDYSEVGEERTVHEQSQTMGSGHSSGRVHSTTPPSGTRRQSVQRGDSIYYMRAPGGQQRVTSEAIAGDYGTRAGHSDLNRAIEIARGDNSHHGHLFGGLVQFFQRNGMRSSRRDLAMARSTFSGSTPGSESKQPDDDTNQNNLSGSTKEVQTLSFCGKGEKPDWYPSINPNEIVLPGSEAQRAIAKQMQLELQYNDAQLEDECVICMDGFTYENPRMPTLCGCGENKTYFHLPCLYQWIEQSRKCPSCREKLVWEEL